MIIANNQLGWLLHWNEEIYESFNLEGSEVITHTGSGHCTRLSNHRIIKLIIVTIILNQIPLVLLDVIKENIHRLFKHATKIINSDIW